MEPSRPASPQHNTDPQEEWRYPRSRAARCRPRCAGRSGTARPSARSAPAEPARRGPAPWRGAGWRRHRDWAGSWRGGAVPASLARRSAAVGAALPAFPLRGALPSGGGACGTWWHAPASTRLAAPKSSVPWSQRHSSPVLLRQTDCEAVVNLVLSRCSRRSSIFLVMQRRARDLNTAATDCSICSCTSSAIKEKCWKVCSGEAAGGAPASEICPDRLRFHTGLHRLPQGAAPQTPGQPSGTAFPPLRLEFEVTS